MAKDTRHRLDNLLDVKTPENISFQYRLGGPFRRLWALAIDIVLSQLAYWLIAILLIMLLSSLSLVGGLGFSSMVSNLLSGIALALGFFVYWFYGAYMETYWNGQSIGKMFLHLRVLRTNGEAIDGSQALLRNFFRLMDFCPFVPLAIFWGVPLEEAPMPLPTFMCGLLVMTFSSKFQRVGDMVAGTIVVHEQASYNHGIVNFADPRVAKLGELLPKEFFVPATLAKALASYVDRRRYLPPQRNNEIASHIAVPLLEKFGMRKDTNHDLLLCALFYKTYISDKQEDPETPGTTPVSSMFDFGHLTNSHNRLDR